MNADAAAPEPLSGVLGCLAEDLAARYGLSGADALPVAAAIRQGARESYASEKPGKPLFRVRELTVVSLHSLVRA